MHLWAQADNRNPKSAASGFRRRRLSLCASLLGLGRGARVLDVGGAWGFWRDAVPGLSLTLLNRGPRPEGLPAAVGYVDGDARDLSSFKDGAFDVAFSNSVIEHVGGPDDQAAMAREVRRVGRRYFVQTPNRTFPIEPHFLFPCFQMLPAGVRRGVARMWPFGWLQAGSPEAMHHATAIRLLDVNEMSRLFPDAVVLGEQCLGLTKSLIALGASVRMPRVPGYRILRGRGMRPMRAAG